MMLSYNAEDFGQPKSSFFELNRYEERNEHRGENMSTALPAALPTSPRVRPLDPPPLPPRPRASDSDLNQIKLVDLKINTTSEYNLLADPSRRYGCCNIDKIARIIAAVALLALGLALAGVLIGFASGILSVSALAGVTVLSSATGLITAAVVVGLTSITFMAVAVVLLTARKSDHIVFDYDYKQDYINHHKKLGDTLTKLAKNADANEEALKQAQAAVDKAGKESDGLSKAEGKLKRAELKAKASREALQAHKVICGHAYGELFDLAQPYVDHNVEDIRKKD